MFNGWAGTAFLMASNWTKFSPVVHEAGDVGIDKTLCIGNAYMGEEMFTGANGDKIYAYPCFTKYASTLAQCEPFILQSEIDILLDRGQTWYDNNQPNAEGQCFQYVLKEGVVMRAKCQFAKQPIAVPKPCAIVCGGHVDLGNQAESSEGKTEL